jgi:hypothetical protein
MNVIKDEWDLFSQIFLAKQVGSGAGTIFPDPDTTSPKGSGYIRPEPGPQHAKMSTAKITL